jgi:hypothetical protein
MSRDGGNTHDCTPDPRWTTFDAYDLTESIDRVRHQLPSEPVRVIAACGESPEGYGSWHGGFVLLLADGSFALVTGWCDTTGWGCQDGAEVTVSAEPFATVPNRVSWAPEYPPIPAWTREPAALSALQKALDEHNAERARG